MTSKSYYHNPMRHPFQWMTIPDMLVKQTQETPEKEAYVVRRRNHPREAITFRELNEKTKLIAGGMLKLGLRPGDVVIISGITTLNWILCDLAAIRIGVVTIHCEMRILGQEGLVTNGNLHKVKGLFFHPGKEREFEEHLRTIIPDAFQTQEPQKTTSCSAIPSLHYLVSMSSDHCEGVLNINDLIKCGEGEGISEVISLDPGDTAIMFLTSGSSGVPKCIPVSHVKIVNLPVRSRKYHVLYKDCRLFTDRSLAWPASMQYVPLGKGCCNVYMNSLISGDMSDVEFCIQVILEEKCSVAVLMQYSMADLIRKFESGTSHLYLNLIILSGDIINGELLKKISKYTQHIIIGYGSIETGSLACSLFDDKLDNIIQYAGKVDVGCEVKILNEHGQVVPWGEAGEIVARRPLPFVGYLPKGTVGGMKKTEDGWVYTDDVGRLFADGYLQVLGRKSQLIRRGFHDIYPPEVERIILQCDGVDQVVVVGVPDERLVSEVCACVVPKPGLTLTKDDVLKYFDEAYLGVEDLGNKPGYIMIVDHLSMIGSTKVDRKGLRRMAVEALGLKE